VPPRIADLVWERARQRQLSTSRYLTRLIEEEVETDVMHTAEELDRILEESNAEIRAGTEKVYTHLQDMIRDMHRRNGIA